LPDNCKPGPDSAGGNEIQAMLAEGLASMGLSCSAIQQSTLLAYLDMLKHWNSTYNLTAIRDTRLMLTRHLLDSLAVNPFLRGARFIDLGTGAGLPGVPLAIVNPNRSFDLLDSNGKKTRFLFQVRLQLGIFNIRELNTRVESHRPLETYDGILSRGFAGLAAMVDRSRHLLGPGGHFYAMKGKLKQQELAGVSAGFEVEAVERLYIPGLEEDRHLIIIRRI
jgi:16S rRNA (guanine527-N7)-methyltransferase